MKNVIYLTVKHTVILANSTAGASKLSLSYGKVLLSLSLLLLGLSTQFCGHATTYMESRYSQSGLPSYGSPSYGSNWGHKIADFLVLPYIYFKTTITFIKLTLHNI